MGFVWEPASHGFLRVGHRTSGREALTLDERHVYHREGVPNSLTCGVRHHLTLELRGVEVRIDTFQDELEHVLYALFALLLLAVFREKVVILEVIGLSLTHPGEENRDGSPVAAHVPLKPRNPRLRLRSGSVPKPAPKMPAGQRTNPGLISSRGKEPKCSDKKPIDVGA